MSFLVRRPTLLAALCWLAACGSDATGPAEPPKPGSPPEVSGSALVTATGDVPFPLTLRVSVRGDSLARLVVRFEDRVDTVAPLTAQYFDLHDTMRVVGPHAVTLILESAAGRADTSTVAVTGTNPLPVISSATLGADSTEITDSVRLRVSARDNRRGISLVTEYDGVRDSVFSADSTVTRDRWLHRSSAGSGPVSVRVRDADGGLQVAGLTARFYVIPPSAELRIPVRADTAPLVIAATVRLHRATVPYDSVRVTLGDGRTRLFTGLGREDSATVVDTLQSVGVTGVTAHWYHPAGSGLLRDSVEVLLAPNQPPTGSFTALADTVSEGTEAPFQLSFADDRGVRLARVYRLRGDSAQFLRTIPLGDAKSGTVAVAQALTPRRVDTLAVELEDRDGATIRLVAAPVYTDGAPLLSGAVLGPKRALYRDGVPLLLRLTITDEGPVECTATSSLGAIATGSDSLAIPVRNPTVIEDSLRVTATVSCRDGRGQESRIGADTATVLHADAGRIVLIDITTGARVDRTLSVNGETFTSQGQEVGLGFRGVTSLQVRDLGSKWTALVRKDSVARYNANGVVNMPFANGDVDTLYVIPNTPEGIQAAKNAARLISADTSGRRITRWLPDQDVDPALGIQLATDYWDYEHFSRDRPDSALVAAMRGAHDSLMSEVGALLPLSRRVALVQVDSGITTSVRYAYEQYFGGMNVWGPAYAATLFQGWRATRSLEVAEYFPCVNQIMVLGSHWYGVGFRDDSGPLGGAVEVFVHGRESEGRAFLEPYFSFDTCSLTALGRSVFVMQALFGNRTLDLP